MARRELRTTANMSSLVVRRPRYPSMTRGSEVSGDGGHVGVRASGPQPDPSSVMPMASATRCGASEELVGGDKRMNGVTSVTRSTTGLGGMVQWSVADGRVWLDVRRMVALFGVVVTSMADGTVKIYAVIPPEDETLEDGDT
ncbi:Kinesin-4 [Hordeum vulgare]|nr:Kinesin-4 [Hordeum vulgare]